MAHPLTVRRPQDEHSRLVRDSRWIVRGGNGVLEGEDTVSGETLLFRVSHVQRCRRVDRGPSLRPTGIRFEPPPNINEREYLRLLDEIDALKADIKASA